MAKIYGKGQVVLPKSARDTLGLGVGDDLLVEVRGHEIVLRKPQSAFELKPPHPRRSVELDDRATIDAAWEDHVAEKFGRGDSG